MTGGGAHALGGRHPDVHRTQISAREASAIRGRARSLGARSEWGRFFAQHSRSFFFASRLFSPVDRRRVREIYAWCRFTDDLVDGSSLSGAELYRTLDAWGEICRAAYGGEHTGIDLADAVMHTMADQNIPFRLAEELIEGVRMDIEPRTYATMADLARYTHRVASVVGAWMAYSFGVRSDWIIERAHALGHAMQLTNIVRDVGEDLQDGRVYLPRDRMTAHGLSRAGLLELKSRAERGHAVGTAYAGLLEEVVAAADVAYSDAFEAMPDLPARFGRAVAVAAQVYQGIHNELRSNRYDNLSKRAHTSLADKLLLALQGHRRLSARRRQARRQRTAVR